MSDEVRESSKGDSAKDSSWLTKSIVSILVSIPGLVVIAIAAWSINNDAALRSFYLDNWQSLLSLAFAGAIIIGIPVGSYWLVMSCGTHLILVILAFLLAAGFFEIPALRKLPQVIANIGYYIVEKQEYVVYNDDIDLLPEARQKDLMSLLRDLKQIHKERIVIIGVFTGHKNELEKYGHVTYRIQKKIDKIESKALPPEEQKAWDHAIEMARDRQYESQY